MESYLPYLKFVSNIEQIKTECISCIIFDCTQEFNLVIAALQITMIICIYIYIYMYIVVGFFNS
jgi:hypothetical protein